MEKEENLAVSAKERSEELYRSRYIVTSRTHTPPLLMLPQHPPFFPTENPHFTYFYCTFAQLPFIYLLF